MQLKDVLDGFPVITEIPVAWGDMDALQHVNNVVYFRYFESARINYLQQFGLLEKAKTSGIGPVVSHTECFYKAPVTFPDTLQVGARVSEVRADRFIMEYKVFSTTMQRITTTGTATVVLFDFTAQRKAQLPAELIQKLELNDPAQ